MERTNLVPYNSYVSLDDVHMVESLMSKEENNELNSKMRQIIGCSVLERPELLAYAEKMFKMGYLAAHISPPKL